MLTRLRLISSAALSLALSLALATAALAQGPDSTLPAPAEAETEADPELVWGTDSAQVLAQAQAQGRPVYLYVWAKYHPDCVQMAQFSLPYPRVASQLTNFELLALDAHNPANFAFFDQYQVPYLKTALPGSADTQSLSQDLGAARWPTHLFLDPRGREVFRTYGFLPGQAFAEILSIVRDLFRNWEVLQTQPDSAEGEAGVGHAYLMLEVAEQARTHLERALQLAGADQQALQDGVRLDLTILRLPDDPPKAQRDLQQWREQHGGDPRAVEALYYEAVAEIASERLDRAERLLQRFEQAQPGTPEYESKWYAPGMLLLKLLQKPATTP